MANPGKGVEAANSRVTVRDLRLGVPQTADDSAAGTEDTPLAIDALANDLNAQQPGFAPVVVEGPAHGTVSFGADGQFHYTPVADWNGEDRFTYKLSDRVVDSNLATVTVTMAAVNDAPTLTNQSLATDEDTPVAGQLLATAFDVEGDTLAWTLVAGPQHGQLEIAADGSFVYTPDADFNGEDGFSYRIREQRDGGLESPLATVRLTVRPVNDAPTIAPRTLSLDEDTTLVVDLLSGAVDVDGDALTVAITVPPLHGSLQQNADGSWTYTPEANWNGTEVIGYTVSDGLIATPTTLTLVVNAVNDAPTIAPRTLTLDEDTALVVDLLAGAADVDGDALTVAITVPPQHGSLLQNADGTWTYTPDANWNGTEIVEYTVSDGLIATPTTLTLVVNAVNDAPIIAPRTLTLDEDTTLVVDLLAGAADVDGDALTVEITVPPQHGRLAQNADGTWTYTPDANWNGTEVIGYTVSDGLIATPTTLTLVVNAVNDAPELADQALATDEDTPVAGNLLATASDIEGDTLQGAVVDGPLHGQVSVAADGSFVYTPDADWYGTDTFTYRLNDGELDSRLATVTVTVAPVNDAPVVSDLSATLLEDGSLVLNLLDGAFDVDGDALTATPTGALNGTLNGTLMQNPDGTWTYAPFANWNGDEVLQYSVNDGQAESNMAMIRLTVTAVNDAPSAGDDSARLAEDGQVTLELMANDVDLDGDALTLVIDTQPLHGTLVENADGTVTYVPAANWSGEDFFTYHVFDGELNSAPATVRLVVDPVADAPTLVLTEQPGATSEVFRTSWENAPAGCDGDDDSDGPLLRQTTLDGWTVVQRPIADDDCGDDDDDDDCGPAGFELWHTGDRMKDASHKKRTVAAATGNGTTWLEISDAKGEGHETYGIERTIRTVAGATYALSMDLAGHLGYSADYTRIGIYVNGVQIGMADNTSPVTALAWVNRSFSFVGNGSEQTIRIVAEPTKRQSNGRGMMVDDIALVETLPPNTVRRDASLKLSAIGAALTDTDGSETLTISIGALPVGATLSDGTNVFVATEGQTTADITGWNLGNLVLDLPADVVGTLSLSVTATASEVVDGQVASTASTSSTSATIAIHVLPQIDDPATADEVYAAAAAADSACVTLVVAGDGEAGSGITIDWSGTLTSLYTGVAVRSEEWVDDVLCPSTSEPSLAEQTGLVVQVPE